MHFVKRTGWRLPLTHFRVMDGYSTEDLQRLLDTGEPIQGWCQQCGETWNFTEQERAGIAKGLAEGM